MNNMLSKIKYELFRQRHVREIFLLYLIVLSLFFFMIYTSLAIFEKEEEINNVATIKTEPLAVSLTTTSTDYNTSTGEITIEAGSSKVLNLTFTNNSLTDVKYKLYYQLINPTTLPADVTLGVVGEDNAILEKVGSVNVTNSNNIVIYNDSENDITIKVWYDIGYGHNDIELSSDKLVFDKIDVLKLADKILEDNPVNTNKPDFNTTATTDEGIFRDVDDDGDTYYFRGAVEDNYVKIGDLKWSNTRYMDYDNIDDANLECDSSYSSYGFSSAEECKEEVLIRGHEAGEDMLWRIVRINGDGTIRLIADGLVGTSRFNSSYNNEKYVGYTYDNSAPNVQDGTNSTIKTYLESWYATNLSEYDNLIASTRYCNDTSVSSTSGSIIYYGAYERLVTDKTPQFTCPNTEKTYGGEYDLKIGLLMADEVAFAGGKVYTSNYDYYLQKMDYYWLGTPYRIFGDNAYEFFVRNDSYLSGDYVYRSDHGVAPVINLRSDVLYFKGEGTKDSPYVVGIN